MLQQIIAIILILFFVFRLIWQKRKDAIGKNEFIFWMVFWLLSAISVILIKFIDKFVAYLGFSGTGIQIIGYLSIVILFYLIFRIGLRLEKIEKNITKIVRHISLKDK